MALWLIVLNPSIKYFLSSKITLQSRNTYIFLKPTCVTFIVAPVYCCQPGKRKMDQYSFSGKGNVYVIIRWVGFYVIRYFQVRVILPGYCYY